MPITEKAYYSLRSVDPIDLSSEDRAVRFLYLNRFCFNGVYRTNAQGRFNVARGKHMGAIPAIEEIIAFGALLKNTSLLNCDFSELISSTRKSDFIYMDPPYAGRNVRDRGEYGVGAFKEHDLQRMACLLEAADRRGAKVLLSYADIPVVRKVFRQWKISTIAVERNVSGFTRGRTKVKELLVQNYG